MISERRINALKNDVMNQPRFVSCEQALIITEANKKHQNEPEIIVRAWELREAMQKIRIEIRPEEWIVGNRSVGIRSGIVYPRCGLLWIEEELDSLPTREQDSFQVREEDKRSYREQILPYWKDKTLEGMIKKEAGSWNEKIQPVVKVNQQGRSQGHIIPNMTTWLKKGPQQLAAEAAGRRKNAKTDEEKHFYRSVEIVMAGASEWMNRYADLAEEMHAQTGNTDYECIAGICRHLAQHPAETFHQALQAEWFLLAMLHLEANAMSFSLGRMDQYLLPYYQRDIEAGILTEEQALTLIECFYLKCNQIVCLCNRMEAQYFAGFPIGFNIVIGGCDEKRNNKENALTFLMLKAQKNLNLPQPNLSARVFEGSGEEYLNLCADVLEKGGGLPQFFNDESIIPAMLENGLDEKDAAEYGVVGCVELSGSGNMLAWSNAAMFNMVKVLELTLNHGKCLLTGEQLGPDVGGLDTYESYEQLEAALEKQMDYFVDAMIRLHMLVDQFHQAHLPTPLLSAVIDGCMESGKDVSAGGAKYNQSGIQLVQIANLVDCLAALKELVYSGKIDRNMMWEQLKNNWSDPELHEEVLAFENYYGNDKGEADQLSTRWVSRFKNSLNRYRNARGGEFTVGLYTVSAHVPMGKNVGASCDGRKAGTPLADGGVSPRAGVDIMGPTAVLKSVSAIPSRLCGNGTLLNMKFSKSMFLDPENRKRFLIMLRAFIRLNIHHVQFNVVDRETLLRAQEDPAEYKNLIIRVAGYSAYFVELDKGLQNEIISRTESVI